MRRPLRKRCPFYRGLYDIEIALLIFSEQDRLELRQIGVRFRFMRDLHDWLFRKE